ncbi:MAG: 1-(5-phosphoribosyl)-5-amino-4-imidazole-carboxylate carboxylase, partial [Desulfobacterales bacterium]|nr:1-(5-phosphoribosyl)-5-amino-4-imidazole-carboxylate carboxylase [Desulfobacterales bacterium]
MDIHSLNRLLTSVANGETPVAEAEKKLRRLPHEDIGFAHIDHHRSLRKGFPEVIYGEGKTAEQIIGIMERMGAQENVILATRVDAAKAEAVTARFPDAIYHADARMVVWTRKEIPKTGKGTILVISAGTSDIPVAREAHLTAEVMGNRASTIFDVGVAGI